MNGRTSGTFMKMGPARGRANRKRLLYVGAGTVTIAALCLSILVLMNKSVGHARVDYQEEILTDPEIAFGTIVLLAPAAEIGKGTKLSRVSLQTVYWPRDKVPEGAIRGAEDVTNMYAKSVLPANQPILRSSLSPTPPSMGISELLTEGHRAITIEVSATAGVEGWASAGAHVDVLLTYVDPQDGITKTRVVVEDAVVLSYNGDMDVERSTETVVGRKTVKKSSTCTLMVLSEDALKVHTARSMGRISLALRNVSDSRTTGSATFEASEWSKREKKTRSRALSKKVDSTTGFAKFTDSLGNEKNLILKENNQWWHSGGDTDEDEG